MPSKNVAVFGIYTTPVNAEMAVDHLLSRGFPNAAISVLLPDDASTRAFAHEKSTKAPEGTTTGVTTGGVIGGTLGLLAGIGALAIPGVGPLIAAGPIMATLAGVGVGGAVGGIVGALVGMGIPEYEAKRYEGAVKDGGTLLSVHCDTPEQIATAKAALKETGGRDIASSGEASSKSAVPGRETAASREAAARNIPPGTPPPGTPLPNAPRTEATRTETTPGNRPTRY
ncbi:MAG TPA: hypothetical protein VNW54_06710 [Granulicella sp.]|jgi:hypothetical protein|nr:hypothetical protein [Granulicella sp.]